MAAPIDGAVGTITLIDGDATRQAHGAIRSFLDDDDATRWEIVVDHEIIENPSITAIGFQRADVIDFTED
jgi:hypothetical protein